MGRCRLLHFVKSKKGTKCKNFAVLLHFCQYIHSFVFSEMAGTAWEDLEKFFRGG